MTEESALQKAKETLKCLFENDKNLQLYIATGRVDYCTNKLASELVKAFERGQRQSVRLPERRRVIELCVAGLDPWNACIDEVKRLNGVPEGKRE